MAIDFAQVWKMAEKPREGIKHRITVSEIVAIGTSPFEIAIVRDGNKKLREVPQDNTQFHNGLKNRWNLRVGMKLLIKVTQINDVIRKRVLVLTS